MITIELLKGFLIDKIEICEANAKQMHALHDDVAHALSAKADAFREILTAINENS